MVKTIIFPYGNIAKYKRYSKYPSYEQIVNNVEGVHKDHLHTSKNPFC